MPFAYSTFEMVLMGRAHAVGLFALPSAADKRASRDALAQLVIGSLAESAFPTLSGGQRQLALIARAIASEAKILLLDEPTSALDLRHQGMLAERLKQLSKNQGHTVIFSTHDPGLALAIADHALLMFEDQTFAAGSADEIVSQTNLTKLYGIDVVLVRAGGLS